jgi:hypothetical protein
MRCRRLRLSRRAQTFLRQVHQPTPDGQPAGRPPEASASPLDAEAIAAEVFDQAAASPEALIAAARAAEIERSGATEIDPGVPAALAELEAEAAEELSASFAEALPLVATLDTASPAPSPDGSLAPSPDTPAAPAPEASASAEAGRLTFLAATRPGPPAGERRFDQGGSYLSSIGEVLGYACSSTSTAR